MNDRASLLSYQHGRDTSYASTIANSSTGHTPSQISFSGPAASMPAVPSAVAAAAAGKNKSRRGADSSAQKRRCVSTACVACRKRKSKCDGALPSCAACASVYYTECVYDPNSDHRRKGVYREKVDSMKAQNSTLQILIEAILNAAEDDVPAIVHRIRTCDSLDAVAESLVREEMEQNDNGDGGLLSSSSADASMMWSGHPVEGEVELARKMGELRLENGSVRFIGGTSHLIYLGDPADDEKGSAAALAAGDARGWRSDAAQAKPQLEPPYRTTEEAINSWTSVTSDTSLILYLMNMYFNWHYTYFTTLSKSLFYDDFLRGRPQELPRRTVHCTSLLVNAMLSLGCHFTSVPGAFAEPGDSRTKGDHFFAEAKRLIVANDEYETPRLATVQALALMSVREAGCAREAKGWVYSGMSFRMAQDIGLNLDTGGGANAAMGAAMGADGQAESGGRMDDGEIDARRVTFWGCFLFDKAWSNYLGRLPQLPKGSSSVPKYDVLPQEDAETWAALTDAGYDEATRQPCRTRAAGLELSKLCEISSDLLLFFYHPNNIGRSHSKAVELKKLSELHRRLEDWRRELPGEFDPKEGQRPNVILTHMFFHLQYIHLFRPFLKYAPAVSPLPSHVSPRRICTVNAGAISKLMRLYKKTYNLRQICNIAVYMIHSACTIHMLNLPEKTAKRDIIHGVKQLEEIAEDWLCARRTLCIISVLARKWGVDLPAEASAVLQRTDEKFGSFSTSDVPSPNRSAVAVSPSSSSPASPQNVQNIQHVQHAQLAENVPISAANAIASSYGQLSHVPPQPAAAAAHDLSAAGLASGYVSIGSAPTTTGAGSMIGGVLQMVQAIGGGGGGGGSSDADKFSGSPYTLGGDLPPVGTWSVSSSIPQTMPGYAQPQLPASAQPTTTTTAPAQHMSSPLFALDGQDWLLREGASWQHNFETWGINQQQHPRYPSPQQQQQQQQKLTPQQQQQHQQDQNQHYTTHPSTSPASTGNASTPMSDSYGLFHGTYGADFDLSLDSLGGSGASLDQLGLE